MNNIKVIKVNTDSIEFENGIVLSSYHQQNCCENHWLDFGSLTILDFQDLEFDLTGDFFKRIEGYGIELIPIKGFSIKVPGYGSNNGYYSSDLDLCVDGPGIKSIVFNITECQSVSE